MLVWYDRCSMRSCEFKRAEIEMGISNPSTSVCGDYSTPEAIASRASVLEGKTFQDILDMGIYPPDGATRDYDNRQYKGGMGTLVEERFFGYKANSEHDADFPEAGVELKVSCFDKKKNGDYSAGERLVVSMIPYDEPIQSEFDDAVVARKCKRMMLVYYHRDKAIDPYQQQIRYAKLFEIPENDLKIIRDDYRKIASLVQEGKADRLSESLTVYLGACTKGPTAAKSWVDQYYAPGGPKAKKRAFCLKRQYMDYVLHHYLMNESEDLDCIIKGDAPAAQTFEDYVLSLIKPHFGKTDRELCEEFGLEYKGNKRQWSSLSYAMLGVRGEKAQEFEKANISVRTVRLETRGGIKENLSLDTFKFLDLVEEDWEGSSLFEYLEQTRFFFVVLRKEDGCARLEDALFWSMPTMDLDGPVHDCWQATKKVVEEGVCLDVTRQRDGSIRVKNNLPGAEDNAVAHVRPHATKSAYRFADGTELGDVERDAYPLPDGRMMTRQSFWLNNSYIYKVVKADESDAADS